MHKNTKKRKTLWRSIVAMALVCCTVLPMVPQAAAAPLNVQMGKVTIYEYHWINTYEELTSDELFPENEWVDVVLAWDESMNDDKWNSGVIRFAGGAQNAAGESTFKITDEGKKTFICTSDPAWRIGSGTTEGVAVNAETFYTQEKMGHMRLKRTGGYDNNDNNDSQTGSGSKKSPQFRFSITDGDGKDWYWGQEHIVTPGAAAWGPNKLNPYEYWEDNYEPYDATVRLFANPKKQNSKDYAYGSVHIFEARGTFDEDFYLRHDANRLFTEEYLFTKSSVERALRIYVRETKEFDVFMDDITVGDGQTFRINEQVLVSDDVTITVEDGGVMVVNDHLGNNGKIVVEEGGTLIVEDGATITPLYAETGNTWANKIFLQGGNMIVHENGKVLSGGESAGISITGGGSLVNYGDIYTTLVYMSDAAYLRNENGGDLVIGVTFDNGLCLSVDGLAGIPKNYFSLNPAGFLEVYGRSKLVNCGKILTPGAAGFFADASLPYACGARASVVNEDGGTMEGTFGSPTLYSYNDLFAAADGSGDASDMQTVPEYTFIGDGTVISGIGGITDWSGGSVLSEEAFRNMIKTEN